MPLNLKSLIGKLNDATRSAMEAAAGLCMSRTNYDIEIEHYLMKMIDSSDTDVALILKQYGVDKSRLTQELQRSLDRLKTGNGRSPAFSPQLIKMFAEAWTIGSIDYNAGQIRTGFTLLALLSSDDLARATRDISKELQQISVEGCARISTRLWMPRASSTRRWVRRVVRLRVGQDRRRGRMGRSGLRRRRTWTSSP